jgi:hypothetical protein
MKSRSVDKFCRLSSRVTDEFVSILMEEGSKLSGTVKALIGVVVFSESVALLSTVDGAESERQQVST